MSCASMLLTAKTSPLFQWGYLERSVFVGFADDRTIDYFPPLAVFIVSCNTTKDTPQGRGFQVQLHFSKSCTQSVCGIFHNRGLFLKYRREPRAMVKTCIVLGVSCIPLIKRKFFTPDVGVFVIQSMAFDRNIINPYSISPFNTCLCL